MSGAEALEKKLAAMSPGDRVTLDDVMGAIQQEDFYRLGGTLTICVLTLWNGFTVTGQSACADPANYNKEIGEKIAKDNAIKEIWPLMGYDLRCQIQREATMIANMAIWGEAGMELFIGTKLVYAEPMNRLDYNNLRGWKLPDNEDGSDEGYLVEYTDEINPNVEGYHGYVSWSPKRVFERAYRPVKGAALSAAKGQQPENKGAEASQEESWLVRLKEERAQLKDRLEKLRKFISTKAYEALPQLERTDLDIQSSYMFGYLMILDRRLSRMGQ